MVKNRDKTRGRRVRAPIAQHVETNAPSAVIVEAEDGQPITMQTQVRRYWLAGMVRRVTQKNRHVAVGTGNPRGKEIW